MIRKMTNKDYVLIVSIALNIILAWIILSPSTEVQVDDSLNEHYKEEIESLESQKLIDSLIIEGMKIQLDSASNVEPIIKIKLIERHEEIESIPDSAVYDSAIDILKHYESVIE